MTAIDNQGPAPLHPLIARKIDIAFSTIRRNRRIAEIAIQCNPSTGKVRDRDKYYRVMEVLRSQVYAYTNMMLAALRSIGYAASTYSYSDYYMIDTQIHVAICDITFKVWSFDNPQYGIPIEIDCFYYDYPLSSHPCIDLGVPIYTVQKLINSLATITNILEGYQQCLTCHYAPRDELYCGLGLTPIGTCSHYCSRL